MLRILIISNPNTGLAEIMSGYLRFYGGKKLHVLISGKNLIIHPLAEQVLNEDGIDFEPSKKTSDQINPDITIYINKEPTDELVRSLQTKFYTFPNPLQSSDYDEILSAYRSVREEIKKECIEIVGELQDA